MSRSTMSLILALGIVCTAAACTDETVQTGAGAPAGTTAGGSAVAPGSTMAPGSSSDTAPTDTGSLRTVAEVEADLDELLGPDVSLQWTDQVAPPCIVSLMALEPPAGSVVLTGRAHGDTMTEGELETWLTHLDSVARVVPSIDSHYIVIGDDWELLVGVGTDEDGPGQSSTDAELELALDATALVAPEPLPDGMGRLEDVCTTTTSNFTATGTALGE